MAYELDVYGKESVLQEWIIEQGTNWIFSKNELNDFFENIQLILVHTIALWQNPCFCLFIRIKSLKIRDIVTCE